VAAHEAGDVELVTAAQSGDRAALEQLLRRHHDRVRALARRLCGNDADAADATQEALLAIVRGIGRFDQRAAFGTWVYRVATNACLDELRRRARRPVPADDAVVASTAPDAGAPAEP
jgi:RNA polymerase sigma-70 factor (ECF subfamily)